MIWKIASIAFSLILIFVFFIAYDRRVKIFILIFGVFLAFLNIYFLYYYDKSIDHYVVATFRERAERVLAKEFTDTAPRSHDSTPPITIPSELAIKALVPKVGIFQNDVEKSWRNDIEAEGLREGANTRDVIIFSAVAFVDGEVGTHGWIRARQSAFRRAYLQAKMEMLKFVSDTHILVSSSEGGEVNHQISSGFGEVVVAQTYQVIEGQTADGEYYQILVALIWTPYFADLTSAFSRGERLPVIGASGQPVSAHLPKTVGQAVASFGTRIFVNDGSLALLSFAQAAVVNANNATEQEHFQRTALQEAELEARKRIANFFAEEISYREEIIRFTSDNEGLISDIFYDTTIVVEIETEARIIPPDAAEVVWHQIVNHPLTAQKIAIVAVLWKLPKNEGG